MTTHAPDHLYLRQRLLGATVAAAVAGAATLLGATEARADGWPARVTVEVVVEGDQGPTIDAIGDAGGIVVGTGPGTVLARIPSVRRPLLAATLDAEVRTPVPVDVRPESVVDRRPAFGPTVGEHVAITNADAWHAAGFDGDGVKIGVIDFFDVELFWDEDEHGPKPVAGVTARCIDLGSDCSAEFFDAVDNGGEDHGVAVVETILDMAPAAEIYIGQATTVSDYSALVEWFADAGVTVINRSLGSRYDGPGDGRGPLDEVASEATAHGMLWVNSGGNNGEGKYYRHQARLIGNRVAFGPSGTGTYLRFSGCVALGGIRWSNDWDVAAAQRTDYDALLWDAPTGDPAAGTLVDSSRRPQQLGASPIELLPTPRCPGPGRSLYLELEWLGGSIAGDVIEILDYGSGIAQFTQAAGSAAVPIVDSSDPGVVAVGAIDPAATGTVAAYSSRGPTNDGRVIPDVAAPAAVTNSLQGVFAGSSAGAAVVSGGAALLAGAGLAADGVTLADLVRHLAVDRGASGPDNEYGHGEFRLPAPPAGINDLPSTFRSLDVPTRILDTREESAVGPAALIGPVGRGDVLELPVAGHHGVPADGVTAVAVNVVSVAADRPSFVQVLPTMEAALGSYSNLNIDGAGQTRANFAIVPAGADGTISIYSIAAGDIVVDLLGFFEEQTGSVRDGRFVGLPAAQRLLDTRDDAPVGPLLSGTSRAVPMPAGVDPGVVDALVVTVTATAATGPGWVQAYPTDRPDVIGTTSTLNLASGGTVANTAIVPLGGPGISVTTFVAGAGSTHVVVDAIGYVTTDAASLSGAGKFRSVSPNRAFDSRQTGGALGDLEQVVIDASAAAGVTVPDSATAVAWNMAVVHADRPGFLRAWAADQPEPPTSALNWTTPGEIRAAAVISAVDRGRTRIRVDDGDADTPVALGHLIADVFGYFT